MVIFLTASINPNGLEIASVFCAWLAALELVGRAGAPSTRLVLRVGVSSVLLVGSRPLSPVLLVMILGTVALLAADRSGLGSLAHDSRTPAMAAVVAAATVGSAFYVAVTHATTAIIRFPLPGAPSHLDTACRSIELTGALVEQMVGVLGWLNPNTPPLPGWLVDGWEIAVVLLVAVGLVVGTWRCRLVLAAVVLGVLAMPIVSEGVGAARYGYAWQGRYALPIAVGIPIIAGWTIDRSDVLSPTFERWIGAAVAAWVAPGTADRGGQHAGAAHERHHLDRCLPVDSPGRTARPRPAHGGRQRRLPHPRGLAGCADVGPPVHRRFPSEPLHRSSGRAACGRSLFGWSLRRRRLPLV